VIKADSTIAAAAAVLAGCILASDANAANMFTTSVANAITYEYDISPGQSSPLILIPPNTPVLLSGTANTAGERGIAFVVVLSAPNGPSPLMEWNGLESPSPSNLKGEITTGYSTTPDTHIVFIDWAHQVDVEVASTKQVKIKNESGGTRHVVVTLSW
jgi:hypothetical protein